MLDNVTSPTMLAKLPTRAAAGGAQRLCFGQYGHGRGRTLAGCANSDVLSCVNKAKYDSQLHKDYCARCRR